MSNITVKQLLLSLLLSAHCYFYFRDLEIRLER